MTSRIVALSLLLNGLLTGVLLDRWWSEPSAANTPPPSPSPRQTNPQVFANPLMPVPVQETEHEESPAEKIHDLTARIAQLETRIEQINSHIGQLKPASKPVTRPRVETRHLVTLERLLAGGIDEGFADDFIQRQSRHELQRLELQDKAQRQGYLATARYEEELARLDAQRPDLRQELGDEAYDHYLYNNRLNNRVKILSVMRGSAAEQSGLQKNDIILDYDGKTIFNWNELREASSQGQKGEYVTIDILRNHELYSINIPRGPLGVRLGATRIKP